MEIVKVNIKKQPRNNKYNVAQIEVKNNFNKTTITV